MNMHMIWAAMFYLSSGCMDKSYSYERRDRCNSVMKYIAANIIKAEITIKGGK